MKKYKENMKKLAVVLAVTVSLSGNLCLPVMGADSVSYQTGEQNEQGMAAEDTEETVLDQTTEEENKEETEIEDTEDCEDSEATEEVGESEEGKDESEEAPGETEDTDDAQEPTMRDRLDEMAEQNREVLDGAGVTIATAMNEYLMLDPVDSNMKNGTRIRLWHNNLSQKEQWSITKDEKGYLTFVNDKSGKVLDVSGGNAKDGAVVQLYESNNTYAQKWIAVEEEKGIRLISALDENYVLDVVDGEGSAGTKVQLWTSNDSDAQRWTVRSVQDIYAEIDQNAADNRDVLADGIYAIQVQLGDRKVLDVAAGSSKNKANVQIYESNTTKAQRWKVTHDAKGYVTFENTGSGKVLDVANGLGELKANVAQYQSNSTRAQKWIVTQNENGSYTIWSAITEGLVLDIANGSSANGSNLQIYKSNHSPAQQFTFYDADPEVAFCDDLGFGENWYEIVPVENDQVTADIAGASEKDGTNARLYTRNQTYAQMFRLVYKNGYYQIICAQTDKVLESADGDVVPGGNVQQWTLKEGKKEQLFSVRVNENGSYTFINVATGLALDVAGGSASSGTNLQLYLDNGSEAQQFTLEKRTNFLKEGIFSINTALSSKKWLDVSGASTAEGCKIQIWQGNGSTAQKWKIVAVQDKENTYTIESLASGHLLAVNADATVTQRAADGTESQQWIPTISKGYIVLKNAANGRVLDVAGAVSDDGTRVQTYMANGTTAQRFKMVSTPVLSEGTYLIRTYSNKKQVLDVASGTRKQGGNIQVWESNDTGAQKWKVTLKSDGTYVFTNARSKKVLDVLNESTTPGTNVQQWKENGSNAQKWKVEYLGKGAFRIISALDSSMVLDLSGGNTQNGTNVQIYTDNDTDGQKFRFDKTSYTEEPVNLNVPCLAQNPELPSGCESVALTNVLNFYGFNLSKTTMADSYIPRSNSDFVTSFWGNPHSSTGNCCMPPAIVNAANKFLKEKGSSLRAYDVSDSSIDKLCEYLDDENPIIIWTSIYQKALGNCYATQWYNGKEYKTYTNSHTVVLKGYNKAKNEVYLADSISGNITENTNWIKMLYTDRGMHAVVIR